MKKKKFLSKILWFSLALSQVFSWYYIIFMLAYSGKGKFVVENTDVNKLIEETVHLLEVSISKSVVMKYNFAENLPAIEADVTQINQVIMNLITNASEAIGDRSGVISISTGVMECDSDYLRETYLDEELPEGNYVYIEVTDDGCGMDRETMDKIFDPYILITPLCPRTIPRTAAMPRPLPVNLVVKNGSNIFSMVSLSMPQPSSDTSM